MRAILITFDSLNRNLLETYGCDWTHTPNFKKLAERSAQFQSSYVCSMPCMPARRDLHTGRPNFLHRSWGPLEPWDDSVFQQLGKAGIKSHIVTDHQHYWEEGAGGNYLTKYTTHEIVRGQEGDPHYPQFKVPCVPENAIYRNARTDDWTTQDRINRIHMEDKGKLPMEETFNRGIDFIRRHKDVDNWVLQIESFDPHEPFFSFPEHKDRYAKFYEKSRDLLWDWPNYEPTTQKPEEIELMRHNYAALMSECDNQLGRVLKLMDDCDLWDDTLLTVWTDHGFCLGEHDCWAKCWLPFYEEVARTPFYLWDPNNRVMAERRYSLVQPAIDLAPTLLDFFSVAPASVMTGKSLFTVLRDDSPIRETALFGQFGLQVNVTDGHYVYMRGAANESNQPLYEYTLFPAHMKTAFSVEELQANELAEPFRFMKGIQPLKIAGAKAHTTNIHPDRMKTLLYDLEKDPMQKNPIKDPEIESRFCKELLNHFQEVDAPKEQIERLGLKDIS